MELGGGNKYIASHPPHCSLLIWYLCLVRYFISSPPVNLNTKTSPSLSVYAVQVHIGVTIGALLCVGVMFLGFTALGGAFVPGCPFRSGFSGVMEFIFEILSITPRCAWKWLRWLASKWVPSKGPPSPSQGPIKWIQRPSSLITLLCGITFLAIECAWIYGSSGWISLVFFPIAIPIAHLAQQKVDHKPQKYKVSQLAAWAFLGLLLWMISNFYFSHGSSSSSSSSSVTISERILLIVLYLIVMVGSLFAFRMFSKMAKSMADTGEIDAIAWLLITAPPQHPATFFKKAGQMTDSDSIGRDYRPRLLESLMPLLTLLITSYHAPQHRTPDNHSPSSKTRRNFKIELKREQSDDFLDGRYRLPISLSLVDDDMGSIDEDPHLKNLEIYTACLARLSEFKDYEGNRLCLWEDAMQHPKLEQPLIDRLVEFANPRHHNQVGLRSAATKVLENYELDIEGKPVKSSLSSFVSSTTPLMLNINGPSTGQEPEQGHPNLHSPVVPDTRVEPADSSGEIELEEVKPEIGDADMC
jgi:hypothetical protein